MKNILKHGVRSSASLKKKPLWKGSVDNLDEWCLLSLTLLSSVFCSNELKQKLKLKHRYNKEL